MTKLKKCPGCGGMHRKRSTARKCVLRNMPAQKWTYAELGINRSGKRK